MHKLFLIYTLLYLAVAQQFHLMQALEQQQKRLAAVQADMACLKVEWLDKTAALEETSRQLNQAKKDLATNENRVSRQSLPNVLNENKHKVLVHHCSVCGQLPPF